MAPAYLGICYDETGRRCVYLRIASNVAITRNPKTNDIIRSEYEAGCVAKSLGYYIAL